MKINRNNHCWCGSGKKYKKCHLKEDLGKEGQNPRLGIRGNQRIDRSKDFIKGMVLSSRLARRTLDLLEDIVRPGITTNDINQFVHSYTVNNGGIPAPLNYQGFPKSVCTSVNEVICHGIPNDQVLHEGDIVNVDVTPKLNGYHGDTNRIYFVGEVSDEARKLTLVTKECLDKSIKILTPYIKLGDLGAVIQEHAHKYNYSVVEKFVGHGIGRNFHEEPQVPHFGTRGTGLTLIPGMFFTIEPMINIGTKECRVLADNWTAVTLDGKLSAQFEHTLFMTDKGARVLTAEPDDAPIFI